MTLLFAILFFTGLCALSWVDIKTFRLPNLLNYSLLLLGFVQAYFLSPDFRMNMLGAMLGYGAFVAIEKGFKALSKKDGLGRGDAKLLAVGGAWCGAFALPMIVLLASVAAIIGIIAMGKSRENIIPFGPFLSAAIFIVWAVNQLGIYSYP